jgi:hypothetical protein
MDPSPLPAPRPAAVSSPAFTPAAAGAPGVVYFQDGNQLKAYALPGGGLLWSATAGYYWASKPAVGSDGTIYTLTYDLLPQVGAANFVLSAFRPDGTLRAQYGFLRKPTPPLPLSNGLVAVGLSPLGNQTPEQQGTGQEPVGATLVGLTADLRGAWNNKQAEAISKPLATDGQYVYAVDGTVLSAVAVGGQLAGTAPLLDPQHTAELAAAGGACYAALNTGQDGQLYRIGSGAGGGPAVQAWSDILPAAYVAGTLCATADGSFLRTADGAFRAFAQSDGAQRWVQPVAPADDVLAAADVASGDIYLLDSPPGQGALDLVLAYAGDGSRLWSQQVAAKALGPPVPAGGLVAWAASTQRSILPDEVLVYSGADAPGLALAGTEDLPQAVVNGQSTLNPPWPALR